MATTPGPDFLIIGAPETATAVLHDALAQHPQVHLPSSAVPAETGQLVGDSTPYLLWDRPAQHELGASFGEAKLISVVRDPVDRAFAEWARQREEGVENEEDFVHAVASSGRYRDHGLYGAQFTHLFTAVNPRQNLILRHRDVLEHPELSLNRVCELLGIDTGLVEVDPGTVDQARPKPTAEQRAALLPLFAEDIGVFARLVGQEFNEWLEDRSVVRP